MSAYVYSPDFDDYANVKRWKEEEQNDDRSPEEG